MNKKLQDMFDGLNHLCETNEAFYFSEQDYGTRYTIRSYSYRLASCTEFKLPFAKDSRGTAFVYDKETKEWNLFCRAYQKFFNANECLTLDEYMKDNEIIASFEKMDGSLILIGRLNGTLITKSKTSINSDQARLAQKLLDADKDLQKQIHSEIDRGLTPVFELVGPDNVIVLRYDENKLVYLGSVHNEEYNVSISYEYEHKAKQYFHYIEDLLKIKEESKPDIEGFVVLTRKGFIKIKVNSYTALHHLKDSVNNSKALVHLIIDDNLDDLIGSFQDDPVTIKLISDTQEIVAHKFNHLVVEFKTLRRKYYNEFNENRKEFAIKHSKECMFGYVMKTLNTSFRDIEEVAETQVKSYIKGQCKSLEKTDKWLETIKG